jgi:tRNA (guanine-N7-)-methyltransferase
MRPGSTGHLGHKRGGGAGQAPRIADSGAEQTSGAGGNTAAPAPYHKWVAGEILLPDALVAGTAAHSAAVAPGAAGAPSTAVASSAAAISGAGADASGPASSIGAAAAPLPSPPLLDLPAIFGNSRPIEVEIGTGKGTFLLARATARPEMNFLGVEWARAYAIYAADRFRRAGLTNVRMLRCDAEHLFKLCLADRSLWRVHIYFPDPWPKHKHHHRRLIQRAFVEQVRRTLLPGGQLIIVTDHQEYFRHIQTVVSQVGGLAAASMPRLADREGEVVGTNFERKYIAQGRPFYKLARLRYD